MSKKYKYLIAFLIFGILAVVLFWSPFKNDTEHETTRQTTRDASVQRALASEPPVKDSLSKEHLEKSGQNRSQSKLERMKELLRRDHNTPIDFWGKVIDQNENPVSGARAEITVDGAMGKKKYVSYTDKDGLFELLSKRGARIRIKVFSKGYAPTSNSKMGSHVSARTIYYATKVMPAYAPPTRDNPQVFMLRKKNPIANLDHAQKKRVSISKTGAPQKIGLKIKGKIIEVEVRCWSSCPIPFTYDKYDWRAEIQITNGKLLPYNSMNSFQAPQIEAPLHGYQKVFQVDMPKDTDKTWKAGNVRQRDFWIQFDDGTYAKAHIEINTGRKHYVNTEVWYNLDGINNFEQ